MHLIHLVAAAVVAGALTAVWAPVTTAVGLAVAGVAASLVLGLPTGIGRQGLGLLVAAALAAGHAASARDEVLAPPLGLWFAASTAGNVPGAAEPVPVRVRGVLVDDASVSSTGAVRLRLAVRAVASGDSWQEAPGVVQLFVQGELAAGTFSAWTRGRTLETTAVLRWPPVLRNPGGADPMRVRLSRGYVLSGTVKSALLVAVDAGPWWHEAGATVRRVVRRAVAAALGDNRRQTAAVVTAILIGDRAGLDPALTERLIAAGTYHVVAISGGNVAMVTLATVFVLRRVVHSTRLVPLAALAAVLAYGWMVGGEPSVTRAVTAAAVWLAADAFGVRAPPGRIFSVVVCIVILREPLMVVMPGAWLSFGATLGILVGAARIAEWCVRPSGSSAISGPRHQGLRVLAGLGAATVAVEIVLLPVGAWTFSRVSVAGLLLNFIAVPAMAVVQAAGAGIVVATLLVGPATQPAAMVAHGASGLLLGSAHLVEWLPILAWRVPPPPVALVAAYYASVAFLVDGRGTQRVRRVIAVVAAALLVTIAVGPSVLLTRPATGVLRVTFLDVGQGDATVVQFPSGHTLVVDAGAASDSFDTGERVVTPALWALGTRRVDWVAFTHADLDHIGGVAAVAAEFDAREVWEGVPVPSSSNRDALVQAVGRRPVVWRQLRRGDRWTAGGVEVSVLHPPEPDWERPQVRNDDSIVLRVRYGVLDVLLTGDIGQGVERGLVPDPDPDRGDIRLLKVAHHGSRTSTSDALVSAYRPWAAVVSAGRNNTFGHPAPEVLQRLQAAGVTVIRTDRDGAVRVETDGRTVWMRSWSGRAWRARVLAQD